MKKILLLTSIATLAGFAQASSAQVDLTTAQQAHGIFHSGVTPTHTALAVPAMSAITTTQESRQPANLTSHDFAMKPAAGLIGVPLASTGIILPYGNSMGDMYLITLAIVAILAIGGIIAYVALV